jgi:F-type H+-transporting ATPase subunit delta
MSLAVASRYARALVDILLGPDPELGPDQALAQLRLFEALQKESADLRHVLASPAVGAARKKAVVERLAAQAGLSVLVKNVLFVLIDHRRIAMLPDVVVSIAAQLDERRGIARARVTSARPLDAEQQAQVETALARLTGKQVHGEYAVDESLLGGITARVGSRVYDGSVRGQLDSLRARLVRS